MHRLIAVNFISFLLSLPVISWFYLVLNTYLNASLEQDRVDLLPGLGFFAGLLLQLPPVAFDGLFFLSAVWIGPFALGLHAMTGKMLQGDEIWLSDFFKLTLRNAVRGVLLGLFSVVLAHVTLWNAFGGISADVGWISFMLTISRWVSLFLLVLFFLALPFICQITVFAKLPLWPIVKNAVILARVYLGRSLLALFVVLAYWWITLSAVPLLGLFTLPLISLALTVLIQAVVCFPLVEKHVLKPAGKRNE